MFLGGNQERGADYMDAMNVLPIAATGQRVEKLLRVGLALTPPAGLRGDFVEPLPLQLE